MKAHAEVICYKSKVLSDGTFPLMLRITKSRKRKYVSLGISIEEKFWDFEKNKPKRNCPNKEAIEKLITSKLSEYNNLIMTMTTERKEYTPQSLSQIIDNKVECRTVGEMYNLLIAEMEKSGRLGNLAVYKYSRDSLLNFTRNKLDIPFSDIDTNWLKKYESWLEGRECKDTTKSQLFRTLRSVFNKAIEQGIVKQDCYPFNRFKLTKFDLKTQKRAISKEDVQKIIALNLSEESDYMRLARDLFLFSYFEAGINFTDIALITIADINEGRINYIRKKTKKAISTPLCDVTNGIISKYVTENHSDTDYIFPILNRDVHKFTLLQKAN